ncbi:succinate-semialdehyde dehydrogenase/glutarate-semialdehyde dehydrogenase [Novosphingobium chloroacetimidivorans]|uniref:Succinate-semialdehyde dehydrogenase/glutarate-semialdehyde dehydrogenase n=1 Tax=Novosphingobium chloroacetimidivorans TaxID=1428314 RepID=A0A7W7NVS6_9SPHN|nr:succinate-semialdehyde dehydrogenase/glutarate-semialdehyde dehydrogenase [Novosphingobium chloroacetimidivorans]
MTFLYEPKAFIDGRWVDAADGLRFAVRDPADDSLVDEIADCGAEEADAAIAAASAALPSWRARTAADRAQLLHRWHALVIENIGALAKLLTREMGKPLGEAAAEIRYGASFIQWFAEEARRAYGETIPSPWPSARIVTSRQPVGVVAAITPWNFPVAMVTRKAAPALAAGCTMVLKPSEDTPLSSLALAELARRAGIPAGVFNVVPTRRAALVGDRLLDSPDVRKISFTGSTETGRKLLARAAATVKRASMELGGNAPFIVFDDADLEAAVDGAMASKYRNAGQTCVCANRFLVQDGIHDRFVARLIERTRQLKVGPGMAADTTIGPLVNQRAVEKVEALLSASVEAGAQIALGGARHAQGELFFEPTVVTGVTTAMPLWSDEVFGPVASILRFGTEDEAVALANATPFGLAAYFYTADLGRAWRVGEALEFGMVGINEGVLSTEVAPFGGVKQSGYGREGSSHGLDEYLDVKYMLMGGVARKISAA